jgi:hypothetical protein
MKEVAIQTLLTLVLVVIFVATTYGVLTCGLWLQERGSDREFDNSSSSLT